MNLNFCIAGGRGFIGKIIRKSLVGSENRVFILSRQRGTSLAYSNNEFRILWDGKYLDPEVIKDMDVFINLSGESIDGRLGKEKKELIYKSRIDSTKAIVNAILKSKKIPDYFFQASATGIYKESEDIIDENSSFDEDFISNVVKGWEDEIKPLRNLEMKLFIMRFGVVLGRDGGIFKKMNSLFKLGLGGIPGSGNYYISWIYEKDLIRAMDFLQKNGKSGVYNFVSPGPVRGFEFFKAWGSAHKKPVIFHIPFFLLSLIYGKEIKSIIGKNLNVHPGALKGLKFDFLFEDIKDAFIDLLFR